MAVGQPQQMLLKEFGRRIKESFGTDSVYHVGSSLNQKDGWRDVDVRLLLDDDEWKNLFGTLTPKDCHYNEKWRALCIVFSDYGRHTTGLPIDFQIQRVKEANEEFPVNRSHLGIINVEP